MSDRLMKLQKSGGAFNTLTRQYNESDSIKLKLSREEEEQLTKAVTTVDSLKSRTRLMMAEIKVTDLKKEQERKEKERLEQAEAANKQNSSAFMKLKNSKARPFHHIQNRSECAKTNMNINFMIMQAREEVNKSIQNLMSKTDHTGQLKIQKMAELVEEQHKENRRDAANAADSGKPGDEQNGPSDQKDSESDKNHQRLIPIGTIMFDSQGQ